VAALAAACTAARPDNQQEAPVVLVVGQAQTVRLALMEVLGLRVRVTTVDQTRRAHLLAAAAEVLPPQVLMPQAETAVTAATVVHLV